MKSKTGRPVNIGLIGTGDITRIMRPSFANKEDYNVIAVADVNEDNAREEAAALGGAEVYTDYKELLTKQDIDAVYIATPPFLHRAMVEDALRAGKHILCEKPFMMNRNETEEIVELHRKKTELLIACCSCRFIRSEPANKAREMIAAGQLGKFIRGRFKTILPRPRPLSELKGWQQNRKMRGGGSAMDWGVYDLDCMRYVLGDLFKPVALLGKLDMSGYEGSDIESGFEAEIHLASGATVLWERRHEIAPPAEVIELRGSLAGLDMPLTPKGEVQELIKHELNSDNEISSQPVSGSIGKWMPFNCEPVRNFAAAIKGEEPVNSGLEVQLVMHAILDALYESAQTGKLVEVKK